jgi:hypothetical protein
VPHAQRGRIVVVSIGRRRREWGEGRHWKEEVKADLGPVYVAEKKEGVEIC